MAHSQPMKNVRIPANLIEEVRCLPLPQKSIIKRIEFLIRLGVDHVIATQAKGQIEKTGT